MRLVPIATHCTEADVGEQHVEAAHAMGMDVSGFPMLASCGVQTILQARKRAG